MERERVRVRVLIVEDSRTQAEKLKFILEEGGFQVSAAGNGKEALAILEKETPDVVVSDVVMPEMDGFELCGRIRKDPRLADTPVVLVTALSDPTDVIRGLTAGASNFITKPYDGDFLVSRIGHLLANRDMRRRLGADAETTVFFAGKSHRIEAGRLQILDLLLSTYENAHRQNGELAAARDALRELNDRLAETVGERDAEIAERTRAQEALRRQADELEARVRDRTAELQRAYDDLVREARERGQVEAQLRQAQKMEALGTLTGGIAHDFNNILAAIIGFTEIANDHADSQKAKRSHARVLEAAIRGRELVKRMLTFSRQTEQEKKPLPLSSVVKETVKLLRASIPTTVHIAVSVEGETGFILADPVQIQQVVMNLCANAAHAMTDKGGRLEVELSDFTVSPGDAGGMKPGPYTRLDVRDTGTGIDPSIIERIFDPFFTTKKPGEGTGLGLSVVHGIVTQHDGYITVESTPGVGTAFSVYLPKVAEEGPQTQAPDEETPRGNERVLFVDDEEAVVEAGRDLFETLGYKVTATTSSAYALARLKEDPGGFDLVVTDQTMPGMTGMELARHALAARADMPVILCTGFSHVVDAETARRAGIRAFLMKPLTKGEMARTIRRVLDGQQA